MPITPKSKPPINDEHAKLKAVALSPQLQTQKGR